MTPGCDSRGRNDLRGRGGPSEGRWAGCGSPTSPTMQSSMAPSQVVLGGRKVAIRRPRVRCAGAELRIQRGALHLPEKWTPKPGQRLKWNLHRVSGRRAEAGCAEVHHIWRPPTK